MSDNNPPLVDELHKEYDELEETDFPTVIGGIKYKTKAELRQRYEDDLTAFAQLLYDIWLHKKNVAQSTLNDDAQQG